MGYRSNVVIGITKEVMARDLISPEIPVVLKTPSEARMATAHNGFVYFVIEDWKWYSTYEEVQAIEAWFDSMDELEFGAIRMGEEFGDVQIWGCPSDFDIYSNQWISSPAEE